MSDQVPRARLRSRVVTVIAALAAALAVAVVAGGGSDNERIGVDPAAAAAVHRHSPAASPQVHTDAAHAFHDDMRKLWEDHITWTRLAIVSFVDDLPDLKPTVNRLLQNQEDIGDAIKPYYGERAGDRLTKLLKGHINGAVKLLAAAKGGDQKRLAKAKAAWYRNGEKIADFLGAANPQNWPQDELRSMMKTHLDQTLTEAVQRLEGHHRAEVRTYEEIHLHILEMADTLSDGIIAQFPDRFA